MMPLSPGDMVDGYRLVAEVGRGGMGVVYRAYQVRLQRDVALKVLPASLSDDRDLRTRLQREARAVASLRHPAILVIYDVGDYQGTPYLVTEFIAGGTVARYRGRPQPLATVLFLLGPVADALDYAHAQGLLHRDVKPANILLRRDGSPVLADFGLALAAGVDARLTRTGLMMGTPEYMAPEQALQTADALNPKVDQYALAVIAYELLTGRPPFSDPSPLAVAMAHVKQLPPPPQELNPAIGPGVAAALLRGLAKDPHDRFPTVAAFIAALAAGEKADAMARPRADLAPTLAIGEVPAAVSPAVFAGNAAGADASPGGSGTRAGADQGAPRQYDRAGPGMQRRGGPIAATGLLGALAVGTAFALQAHGRHTAAVTRATATATRDVGGLAQVEAMRGTSSATALTSRVRPSNTPTLVATGTATQAPARPSPAPSNTRASMVIPRISTHTPVVAATATSQPPTDTPTSTATAMPSATAVPTATAVPKATAVPTVAAEPPWVAALAPHQITTVAGNSVRRIDSTGATVGTYTGDGGPASRAGLSRPFSVAVDRAGNLLIADTFNNRIRRVAIDGGTITNIADNGDYHYSGDGGPARAAGISPNDVEVDGAGNLIIADTANYRIREVSARSGIITTIAGTGIFGDTGDQGPATQAAIGLINYVTVDNAGNVYLADFGFERIRKVDRATGIITTVAGNGVRSHDIAGTIVGSYGGDGGPATNAALNHPTCVVVDLAGDLYIADRDNHRVRKVQAATGIITTVAGTGIPGFSGDGGPAAGAALAQPSGLALDGWGNLYIADTGNNRVRMVSASTGMITTIAGNGAASSATYGDQGMATDASLNGPLGLAVDRMGNLYIADTGNNRVRVVRGVTAPR